MAQLSSLPTEILQNILVLLPIPSLLAFGRTSRHGHALTKTSMRTLRLGVFHSRLSGIISLIEASEIASPTFSVHIVLPKNLTRKREQTIMLQNTKVASIIGQHATSLRDLEIAIWELRHDAAEAIAKARNLRKLSLRFDHAHTRHPDVGRDFWTETRGSTVWNIFSPPGPGHMDCECDCKAAEVSRKRRRSPTPAAPFLGRLESLSLERAGITDYQLQRILEHNPNIRELRLRKCLGLTAEFFEWLAASAAGRRLEVLHFTHSDSVEIDDRILPYIGKLANLESLSLHNCKHIDNESVENMNKESWHISKLTLPRTQQTPVQQVEIDPEYK